MTWLNLCPKSYRLWKAAATITSLFQLVRRWKATSEHCPSVWHWLIMKLERGQSDRRLVEWIIVWLGEVNSRKFCHNWSALLIDAQRVVLLLWSALLCSFVFLFFWSPPSSLLCSSTVQSCSGDESWRGIVDTSAQTLTRSLWGWPINSIFPGANLQFCISPRVVQHKDQEGGWKSKIES